MRKGRSRSFYSWLVTSWSGKLGVSYLSIFFGLICISKCKLLFFNKIPDGLFDSPEYPIY